MAAIALGSPALADPLRPDLRQGQAAYEARCAGCHDVPPTTDLAVLGKTLDDHPEGGVPDDERWHIAWYASTVGNPGAHVEVARALLRESLEAYLYDDTADARALAQRADRDAVRVVTPLLATRPDLQRRLDQRMRAYRATLATGGNKGRVGLDLRRLVEALNEAAAVVDGGAPSTAEVIRHTGWPLGWAGLPAALWLAGGVAAGRTWGGGRSRQALQAGLVAGAVAGPAWLAVDAATHLSEQLPWGGWFVAVSQLVAVALTLAVWGAGSRAGRAASMATAALALAGVPWWGPVAARGADLALLWLPVRPVVAGGTMALAAAALVAAGGLVGRVPGRGGSVLAALCLTVAGAVAAGRLIEALQAGGWLARTAVYGPEVAFLAVHRNAEGLAAQATALLLLGAPAAWVTVLRPPDR